MSAAEIRKSINILTESFNMDEVSDDSHPSKRIAITYEIVTPESAEHGDVAERGWIDEEGVDVTPDKYDLEDGETAVSKAVEFLRNEGASEPSSSAFHDGVWYTAHYSQNPKTGGYESRSFHLKGFTPEEEEAIFHQIYR